MKQLRKIYVLLIISFALYISKELCSSKKPLSSQITIQHAAKPTDYLSYLEKNESAVWQALETCGIDKCTCQARCDRQVSKYRTKKSKKSRAISQENYTLINQVLKDFNIDQNSLNIEPWNDNSAAGINDTTLFINQKKFNQLSYHAKKFVIGHELQHYIHHDPTMKGIFLDIMNKERHDLSSDSDPLNQYARLKEERADIKTALKGKEYAQGYVEFMQKISQTGENKGITHPKNSKRLAISKSILNGYRTC